MNAPLPAASAAAPQDVRIRVRDLTVGYGSFVLMRDVSFDVRTGDIFFIMGGSAAAKAPCCAPHGPETPRRRDKCCTAAQISGTVRRQNAAASCATRACCFRAARCGVP